MDDSQGRGCSLSGDRINALNKALTRVFYALFILLPILQLAFGGSSGLPWAIRTVVVAGVSFAAVTAVRALIDAPRPYEVLKSPPLIDKDTKGKSFPSRHVFSCFMIAMCWIAWSPGCDAAWTPQAGVGPAQVVGIALLALGVVMAGVRVVGGVHWTRDVVVGAAVGVVAALVGFWLV